MAETASENKYKSRAWTAKEFFFHDAATKGLKELEQQNEKIKSDERSYKENGLEFEEICYFLNDDLRKTLLSSITVEIYCFLAVESYINGYGIRRMGQSYYKCKKKCISYKIKVLLDMDEQIDASYKKKILKLIKRIFNRRNQIVHPSAEEITDIEELPPPISDIRSAQKQVSNMKKFFNLMQRVDSHPFLNFLS
jgi:hypothetical protein